MNGKFKAIEGIPGAGKLFFAEMEREIPFSAKRVYYVCGAEKGTVRGHHAHKKLSQVLVCLYGVLEILWDDGTDKNVFLLVNPGDFLLLPPLIWHTVTWLKSESVLLVLASDYYDEADYMRNYEDFCLYLKSERP